MAEEEKKTGAKKYSGMGKFLDKEYDSSYKKKKDIKDAGFEEVFKRKKPENEGERPFKKDGGFGGDRRGGGFGGDRRSFGDRPKRDFGDRPRRDFGDKPRRSFGDRAEESSEERPFRERRSFGDKPRSFGGDRRGGGFGGKRRSFGDKPRGDRRSGGFGGDRRGGSRDRKPRFDTKKVEDKVETTETKE